MIVVDSTVWVEALRSKTSPEAVVLSSLIDSDVVSLPAPVRVELLSGSSRRDLPRLRRALSAFPLLYPADDTWHLIDDWIAHANRHDQRFGLGDLLIGAMAAEIGALIWSLDLDFVRLERLGLVQLYEPVSKAAGSTHE